MDLTTDETRVIAAYRAIKERGHGELTVAVRHGSLVKLWVIDKWDREDDATKKLKETAAL